MTRNTILATAATIALLMGGTSSFAADSASTRMANFETCMTAVDFNGGKLVKGPHFETRLKADGTGFQARVRDSVRADPTVLAAVNKCATDNGHSEFEAA